MLRAKPPPKRAATRELKSLKRAGPLEVPAPDGGDEPAPDGGDDPAPDGDGGIDRPAEDLVSASVESVARESGDEECASEAEAPLPPPDQPDAIASHSTEGPRVRFADEVLEAPVPLADELAEAPAAAWPEAPAPRRKRSAASQSLRARRRRGGVAKLPEGWVSVLDPTTNKKYYWHRETDTATWERPAA